MASQTATDHRIERRPKLSESVVAAIRKQLLAGEILPGQKLPTEGQLTETFGVSRTVIREALAKLAADGLVEPRQGAGVFVHRAHLDARSARWLRRWAPRIRSRSTCSRCGWRIEIESAGLAAVRRNAAQEAAIQEAFFEFERLLLDSEPTGKADLAFHRAIASATNNPFYVEMLDVLGRRAIPCDVTSPWSTELVLSDEYQRGLQREHLVILKAISAGDAEAARERHAGASHRQPEALSRAPAGAASASTAKVRPRLHQADDRLRNSIRTAMSDHIDYTSRFAIDPAAAAAMGTDELRHHFHIGGLFEPNRIKLTYTHYDRMIVGGAMPLDAPLTLEAIKPTGTRNFLDRRELIAVNIGGAGVISAGGEPHELGSRDMLYVGMGTEAVSFASVDGNASRRNSTCSAPRRIKAIRPGSSASAMPGASTSAARRPRTNGRSSSSSMPRASEPASSSSA